MTEDILDYFEEEFDHNVRVLAVKYFYFESEARLYAARLKQCEIPCFISNANTATALPLGEGGIGLHVRETDLPEASRIIARLDYEKKQDSDVSFHDATQEEIAYQRRLDEQKDGKKIHGLLFFAILLIAALVLLRTFLRAIGWVENWRDYF